MTGTLAPRVLLALWAVCAVSIAVASPAAALDRVLTPETHRVLVDGDHLYFWDGASVASGLPEAEQALRQGAFKSGVRSSRSGENGPPLWVYFSLIVPEGLPEPWVLEVEPPLLDRIDLYHRTSEGAVLKKVSGDAVPYGEKERHFRHPVFDLALIPGPHEVFLRVASDGQLAAEVTLWRLESFEAYVQRDALVYGVYFGIILLVIFANFAKWLGLREPVYGAFFLAVALGTLQWTSLSGFFGYVDLFPDSKLLDRAIRMTIGAHSMAFWLFFSLFFEFKRHHPRLLRVAQLGMGLGALAVATEPLGWFGVLAPILQLFMCLSLLIAPVLLRRLWLEGGAARRTLGLAYLTFALALSGVILSLFAGSPLSGRTLEMGLSSNFAYALCFHVAMLAQGKAMEEAVAASQRARLALADHAALEVETKAAKERALALLAHELRTPLAEIASSQQVLGLMLTSPAPETRAWEAPLRDMGDAVNKLRVLFQLALDGGRAGLQVVPVPALLAACTEALAREERARVVLEEDLPGVSVLANEAQLRVAVTELIRDVLQRLPLGDSVWVSVRIEEDGKPSRLKLALGAVQGSGLVEVPSGGARDLARRIFDLHDGALIAGGSEDQPAAWLVSLPIAEA